MAGNQQPPPERREQTQLVAINRALRSAHPPDSPEESQSKRKKYPGFTRTHYVQTTYAGDELTALVCVSRRQPLSGLWLARPAALEISKPLLLASLSNPTEAQDYPGGPSLRADILDISGTPTIVAGIYLSGGYRHIYGEAPLTELPPSVLTLYADMRPSPIRLQTTDAHFPGLSEAARRVGAPALTDFLVTARSCVGFEERGSRPPPTGPLLCYSATAPAGSSAAGHPVGEKVRPFDPAVALNTDQIAYAGEIIIGAEHDEDPGGLSQYEIARRLDRWISAEMLATLDDLEDSFGVSRFAGVRITVGRIAERYYQAAQDYHGVGPAINHRRIGSALANIRAAVLNAG